MRRLASLLRPEAVALAAACGCMLALALTTAVAVALVGPVLRALLLGTPPDLGVLTGLLPPGLLAARFGFPALIVALALVKGVAYFGQFQLLARIGQRTSSRLRRSLLSGLLSAPPAVLGRHQTGEILSRFQNDATAVEMAVTYALGAYVRDGATALLLLGLCLLLDWRLSLLACAALPLTLVPLARLLKRLRQRVKAASVGQGALGHLVAQGLQGLPSIQVDGLETQEAARFHAVSSETIEHQLGSARVRAVLSPLMELAAAVGICGMLIVAADSVARGTLDGVATGLRAAPGAAAQGAGQGGALRGGGAGLAWPHRRAAGRDRTTLGADLRARPSAPRDPLPGRELRLLPRSTAGPRWPQSDAAARRTPGAGGPEWGREEHALSAAARSARAGCRADPLRQDSALHRSSAGLGGQLAWVGQEPFLFDGTVAENIALGPRSLIPSG